MDLYKLVKFCCSNFIAATPHPIKHKILSQTGHEGEDPNLRRAQHDEVMEPRPQLLNGAQNHHFKIILKITPEWLLFLERR